MVGVLALSMGFVQEDPKPEEKTPPPPAPEYEKIHYFVGTWDGVMDFQPSAHRKACQTTAVATYEAICNGFFVTCDWVQQPDPGQGGDPYEVHAILTFDRNERGYRLWWLDSKGRIQIGLGRWKENTISFEIETRPGGRDAVTVVTYEIVSDTEHKIKMENAWKGEDLRVVFTSTFTKRD
jgi:hypothetical protein